MLAPHQPDPSRPLIPPCPGQAYPEQLARDESAEIAVRRQAAGLSREENPTKNYTGLALSGGGVRSAAFNLGVLQALASRKLLRVFDFLSSVSGGGYIAAFLDCLIHKARTTSATQDPATVRDQVEQNLVPNPRNGDRMPEPVKDLMKRAEYLDNSWDFGNRYLRGLLGMHLLLLSGVFTYAFLLAWLWRILDHRDVVNWLHWKSNGMILQWNRPFLPVMTLVFVLVLAWFVTYTIHIVLDYCRQPNHWIGRWLDGICKGLLLASGLTLLIGLAVWLATPNMNWTNIRDRVATPDSINQFRSQFPTLLSTIGLLLLGLILLPFLRPKSLIQSGTRVDSPWRQWIFGMAGIALAFGIPFFAVVFCARHGISGTPQWERAILPEDIRDWKGFWLALQNDKRLGSVGPLDCFCKSLKHHTFKAMPQGWPTSTECAAFRTNWKQMMRDVTPEKLDVLWPSTNPLPFSEFSAHDQWKVTKADDLNRLLANHPSIVRYYLTTLRGDLRAYVQQVKTGTGAEQEEAARLATYIETPALIDNGQTSLAAGHLILRALYPEYLMPVRLVFRPFVIDQDQVFRYAGFLISGCVFLVLIALLNLNWTSMHGYYRRELVDTFFTPLHPATPGASSNELPLDQVQGHEIGFPYHLLTGATDGREEGEIQGFLFSPRYCGNMDLGFCDTQNYRLGTIGLSTAVAISGAVANPVRFHNWLLRIVLMVTNFRLGQWLPSPELSGSMSLILGPRFVPYLRILATNYNAVSTKRPTRRFVMVTDGGFYENLGVEPLLDRRCRFIVASDAGADPHFIFEDFVRLYRRCKLKGIHFLSPTSDDPINLEELSEKHRTQPSPYVIARIRYPNVEGQEPVEGLFIYIKALLLRRQPFEVWQYSRINQEFPNDSTFNQFFTQEQFDAYRTLGYRIMSQVCEDVFPVDAPASLPAFLHEVQSRALRTPQGQSL